MRSRRPSALGVILEVRAAFHCLCSSGRLCSLRPGDGQRCNEPHVHPAASDLRIMRCTQLVKLGVAQCDAEQEHGESASDTWSLDNDQAEWVKQHEVDAPNLVKWIQAQTAERAAAAYEQVAPLEHLPSCAELNPVEIRVFTICRPCQSVREHIAM